MSERDIEDRIIREPGALGYPNAHIIRNVRVSPATGRVDLMVLPSSGRKKLALVEVKQASSRDASSKLIGQLIMYYAASLQIGLRGLRRIRKFAAAHPTEALSPNNTSLNKLAGGAPSQEAGWRLLREGRSLEPDEIDLFLALDKEPATKLVDSLRLLETKHGLRIRLVIANRHTIRVIPAV
jgi:hypothetical protein